MICMTKLGLWGSPIGVDLGTRTVKASQRCSGGVWRSLTMAREKNDAYTAEEIGGIVRALARYGMAGTTVAVALPQSKVLSARASTPKENSGAPVKEIAKQELARSSNVNVESLLALSWSARSRRSRGELDERQVFGCTYETAEMIHHGFAAHGMDAVLLEPGAVSAARGAFNAIGLSGEEGLLVDLGWSSVRMIAASDSRLVYERSVAEYGMCQLAGQIAGICSLGAHHAWMIGGIMARRGGDEAILAAQRSVVGIVDRFAHDLMIEIERGASFAQERYGVNTDQGVMLTGGGSVGMLGNALRRISDGQLIPAGDQGTASLHAAARGLAIGMEAANARCQSVA